MDLSPNDIRNYEFPNQMRGYDREEVDNFLEQVAAALEAAKQEQLKLSMELDSVKSQLTGLKQFEDTIKNAAIDARRNADSLIAAAKEEAEQMLKEAKAETSQTLESRTHEVSEIEEQITKIGMTRKSYLSRLRSLIESHLGMLDNIERGEEPDFEPGEESSIEQSEKPVRQKSPDDIEVTESTEVKRRRRETVATQPSKPTPIKAEEANAPEPAIEEGLSEASKEDLSEALKGVMSDEEDGGESSGPIDPELAAALDNYKKTAEAQSESEPAPPPAQPQDEMQETTARAEDIPNGFITNEAERVTDTDKVQVDRSEAPQATENEGKEKSEAPDPDSLAKNLDDVVAKFEEEMNKAEQH